MEDRVESSGKESSKEEGEAMDTPDRSKNCQIATYVSNVEESPVFNFLKNLSPIGPVKSMPISQTIATLSFSSPPSVFTSPHVCSIRESRFLRRHQLSDLSKPEFSSDNPSTVEVEEKPANTASNANISGEHKENVDMIESHDCMKFVANFPIDYDCNGLEPSTRDRNLTLVPFVPELSRVSADNVEANMDPSKERTARDWDDEINASDLLTFESPAVEGSPQENVYTLCGDESQITDSDGAHHLSLEDPGEKMDNESVSSLCRGMRRRCLVFEMGGARKKHLDDNSTSNPTIVAPSSSNRSHGHKSTRHVLPGIGLHLNALASTPMAHETTGPDHLTIRRLSIGPCSSVDFHPPAFDQELLPNSVMIANTMPLEREADDVDYDNAAVPTLMEDAVQLPVFAASEESSRSTSPKKKRRKVELAGEEGVCKRCNCKKSKCLKLYCECFAAGVYCVEPCACIDCFNKPAHEDTVLATRKQIESRNPLAFAPKVIRGPDHVSITGDEASKTPASARHKRGCNCKKSGCLKKYCECYQGDVGCSINCRCEGCKNVFGRKDGSGAIGVEVGPDEGEMDMAEKSMLNRSFRKATVEANVDPTAVPATTFSSMPPPSKLENRPEKPIKEDEMPDFLEEGGSSSPVSGGIKVSSPNGKRVSPPQEGLRSSRKLILRSIPSFPSLTQNQ